MKHTSWEEKNMKRCPKKAIYIYEWAGKIGKCCSKHLLQLKAVGGVIGFPVKYEEIETNQKCQMNN